MNPLQKSRIKATFRYTWPLYIVSAIVVSFLFVFIFKAVHQIPKYKTLTIFVSGYVSDEKKLNKDLIDKYKEKELKSFSYIASDPEDYAYRTRLTIPGYNSADILIIPESVVSTINPDFFAIELEDQLIEDYFKNYTTYEQENHPFGILLNKEAVKDYMLLPNENCYMFLNAKSESIGEYAKKPNKEHDIALNVVKDWGM